MTLLGETFFSISSKTRPIPNVICRGCSSGSLIGCSILNSEFRIPMRISFGREIRGLKFLKKERQAAVR
jgi:hypothetical protein